MRVRLVHPNQAAGQRPTVRGIGAALERPACPECGATDTVPIMYGYPTPETFEAVERGEIPGVAIGGCVIEPDNPVWGCPACRHRW